MKWILKINGIIESIGGFILIFNPQLLLYNNAPNIQGIAVAKLYGILCLVFGIVSLLLAKDFQYNKTFKLLTLTVIIFHFLVGLYMFGLYQQLLTPHPGASITHLSLSIIFVSIYLKNSQNFNHV